MAATTTAYNLTWQALQAEGWGEERLAGLQREWEAVDFFKRQSETAAFSGASLVATCRAERKEPLPLQSLAMKDVIRSPGYAWHTVADYWRWRRYRHTGTYEDERALMLYYRDRELQLRGAAQSAAWVEMRRLPGVTNLAYFASKYPSGMQCLYNTRQLTLASWIYESGGNSYLGRAAEAEARRRLVVCAIALERYRTRHGSYPADLQALVPELLPSPLLDFMDGKPLRYHLGSDGLFVLYSVGLDCVDNRGKMPPARHWPDRFAAPTRIHRTRTLSGHGPVRRRKRRGFTRRKSNASAKLAERTKGTDETIT